MRIGKGLSGIEAAPRIRRSAPEPAALLYTSFGDR
jgi:hypothetical protein